MRHFTGWSAVWCGHRQSGSMTWPVSTAAVGKLGVLAFAAVLGVANAAVIEETADVPAQVTDPAGNRIAQSIKVTLLWDDDVSGKRPAIVAFVDGVTAAAIGAIAGAVIVIGQRSITDWVTAGLAVVTVALLWRFKKLPEPLIVVAAALFGLVSIR